MHLGGALGWDLHWAPHRFPCFLLWSEKCNLGTVNLGKTMIAFAAMGELVTIFLLSGIEIRTVTMGIFKTPFWGLCCSYLWSWSRRREPHSCVFYNGGDKVYFDRWWLMMTHRIRNPSGLCHDVLLHRTVDSRSC